MTEEPEIVVLLEGRLPDLKPIRARLRGAGVDAELVAPPSAANS